MIRNLGIRFVIPPELLLTLAHLYCKTARKPVLHTVSPSNRKLFGAMAEIEFVRSGESALGHRKIPYRIQQIGLPLTVVPAYAVDVRRKFQFLQDNIPEIGYHYFSSTGIFFLYLRKGS